MATVSFFQNFLAKGVVRVTWDTLTHGPDTGVPFSGPQMPDKTVHFIGTATFFDGITVQLEGSNRLVTEAELWSLLRDSAGADISVTGDAIRSIAENPFYIRPILVTDKGGGTKTDVDVVMICFGGF